MPDYQLKCEKCDFEFEITKKISEDFPTTCPMCKKENALKQVVGATSFILKGSGWTPRKRK